MKQVGSRVVAADGVATRAIDDGVHVVANGERLFEQGFVGADALDWQHRALNLSNGRVAVGGGEPAGITNLPARVAVETSFVEDDIDLIACCGDGNALAVFDDGEDFGTGSG